MIELGPVINVSLDGSPKQHNENRVLPSGGSSFGQIIDFIKGLEGRGMTVGIRSSISLSGCDRLTEFVSYIGRNLSCKHLHLEPISNAMTAQTQIADVVSGEDHTFVTGFRQARKVGAKYGIEAYYSGARVTVSDSFCGAANGNMFRITTEGYVTSCNEVLYSKDKRSALFHYGAWDSGKGFEIFDDRLSVLSRLNGDEITKCQTCFAKYSCVGDCYAKTAATYGQPWDTPYTKRCSINRALMTDEILLGLLKDACRVSAVEAKLKHVDG